MITIDTFYEETIAKLTAQNKIATISKELRSKNENSERVLYVYDIIEELKSFPTPLEVPKDESVSTFYRNLGNKCFQIHENFKAWQYYNLSLLHAPIDSESYCLALSNRSAIFYSLNKYEQCLNDIKFIYSLKYPSKLKDKLEKREHLCIQKKTDNKRNELDVENLLKLQSENDQNYICASKKLQVLYNEEMGQHVIAKEDIKAGEVLAHERPYFSLLLKKSQFLFTCSYCLSRKLNLLPCPKCCYALYCCKDCMENASKDYHAIECSLMPTLFKMEFTKLEWLALRTTIKARNDHESWEGLFKTISVAESNRNTKLHGMVEENGKWVYDSKYYTSVHVLATNIEKRTISDIFQKSVTAAVFLFFLKKYTPFFDINIQKTDPILQCAAGLLLLHTMTSPTNMHAIDANMETSEGNFVDDVDIAGAPYSFSSLLNHSCAPNVVRFCKLGSSLMFLTALRPIKAGMQLFDNYGAHHALLSRHERQDHLKFQYKFTCLCEACINNWPLYFLMWPASNLPAHVRLQLNNVLDSWTINQLKKGCGCVAHQKYDQICNLIDKLDPYAPCAELADCQESLKQCLEIFCGVIPYSYGEAVQWNIPPKQ